MVLVYLEIIAGVFEIALSKLPSGLFAA